MDHIMALLQRAKSAIVIVILSVLCIYAGGIISILFFSICFGIAIKEWWQIVQNFSQRYIHFALGFMYIFCGLFFLAFNAFCGHYEKVLQLSMMVWTVDVVAYICGNLIGGPKICIRISPRKTWSGLIGGVLAGSIVGILEFNIVYSLLLCITAQLGDFLESFYKRKANIKDSGTLIPGHGGILDRIDGLIATSFVVFIVSIFR
jgi:phosphatidate cytidylyltransferase